jgi:hypothetical protein
MVPIRVIALVYCVLSAALIICLKLPDAAFAQQPPATQTFTQPETSRPLPSGAYRHSQAQATEPQSQKETGVFPAANKEQVDSSPVSHWLGEPKNIAALLTCCLIIIGGLMIFYLTQPQPRRWDALSVQTLGTIFFFPTLILLAVYIKLSADAIATILGAFVGYVFNQSPTPRPDSDQTRGPTPRPSGPVGPSTEVGP